MILVFDTETILLASDLAADGQPIGWSPSRLPLLGLSWACVWSSEDGGFHHFDQGTLEKLCALLERADLLVSFNGKRFDLPLLSGLLGRPVQPYRHCDLLEVVEGSTGHRMKLDDLAYANLDMGKSGWGGHAPQLYRDQRYGDLATYCEQDVRVTRDLWFLGAARGWWHDGEGHRILCPPAVMKGYLPKNERTRTHV